MKCVHASLPRHFVRLAGRSHVRILIHLTTGVENPTKAALALLVASTALDEGHQVDVFVAGDGVSALRTESIELMHGIGTGSVLSHLEKLRSGGAGLYASGMSSSARGLTPELLKGQGFSPAPPNKLVELLVSADKVLTY